MKKTQPNPFSRAFTAVVCCVFGIKIPAATIQKAENATDLNLHGSWSGSNIPSSGDSGILTWKAVSGSSFAALSGGLVLLVLMEQRRTSFAVKLVSHLQLSRIPRNRIGQQPLTF